MKLKTQSKSPEVQNGKSEIELSVVMPCLNEEETLATCIGKAQAAFKALNVNGEVVIGDNGSTDGSIEIAESLGARVMHETKKGYGNALKAGIAGARGKYVVMGDADDSYDFGDLKKFLDRLRSGDDLVMGCRMPRGGGTIKKGAMPFLHRYLGNPVLSWIGKAFFKSKVSDFHCGLRGFSKAAFQRMALTTSGMEFASEMVIKATLIGLKISQVPITLHPDGRSRPPHLRTWRDGWRHLRFMLLYSPRWLFLYPGLALLMFGALIFGLVIPGPFEMMGVNFDTNTLIVGSLSFILGVTILGFGVSARIFAVAQGFLPQAPRVEKLAKYSTLEAGLITGAILTLGGVGAIIYILVSWSQLGFGELDRGNSLRIVIPAMTAIAVGVQLMFSSFYLSFINLKR